MNSENILMYLIIGVLISLLFFISKKLDRKYFKIQRFTFIARTIFFVIGLILVILMIIIEEC